MLDDLFRALQGWIARSKKPVVLLIDDVDHATNTQVFLDFLSQLRAMFLDRDDDSPAFQSVVLAGVTDVKHLKQMIL